MDYVTRQIGLVSLNNSKLTTQNCTDVLASQLKRYTEKSIAQRNLAVKPIHVVQTEWISRLQLQIRLT